jgi:hypothetical protein
MRKSATEPAERFRQAAPVQLAVLRRFLQEKIVIVEQFDTDHRARSNFLYELREEHPELAKWIKEHSKLRNNAFFSARCMAESLVKKFPEQGLAGIEFPSSKGYEKWETGQKILYAAAFDLACYDILSKLSE